jgi:hypothetical protein
MRVFHLFPECVKDFIDFRSLLQNIHLILCNCETRVFLEPGAERLSKSCRTKVITNRSFPECTQKKLFSTC